MGRTGRGVVKEKMYNHDGCKEDDGLVQTEKDISGLLADRMMKGCDTPLVRSMEWYECKHSTLWKD